MKGDRTSLFFEIIFIRVHPDCSSHYKMFGIFIDDCVYHFVIIIEFGKIPIVSRWTIVGMLLF